MKWSGDRSVIAAAIREASSDLSAKEDVLGGRALLRLVGNVLTVVGRDMYTTVSTRAVVAGAEDGETCVDHRRLDEFLHRVVTDQVRFSVASTKLKVRAGVATLDLPTQETDGFVLPTFSLPSAVTVKVDALVRCLRGVLTAAHDDSAHPTLWGVHVRSNGKSVIAEASDSRRFARAEGRAVTQAFDVTLNRRFATKLLALFLRDATSAKLSNDGSRAALEVGEIGMIGPLQQVEFPNLDVALTGVFRSRCELNLRELRDGLETVRVSEEAAVRVALSDGKLSLSVRSPEGNAAFHIRTEIVGPDADSLVSLRDFRAGCFAMHAETARVSIGDGHPGLVRLEARDDEQIVTWVLVPRVA